MKIALQVASKLYGIAASARNFGYDTGILAAFQTSLPVVCIGNLTAGGSGKTPLTLLLASELKGKERKPVILSRGYGGSERGPRLVQNEDSACLVGDEPLMMARRGICPVVICRDRILGAQFIAESELGDIILLDDGFQHRRIFRTLNLLAVDVSSKRAIDEFVSGELLPCGRFREDRDQGIKRADAVILNARTLRATAPDPSEIYRHLPQRLPIFKSFVEIESVNESRTGVMLEKGISIRPLCALGNPEGFLTTVSGLGNPVGAPVIKSDHAAFTTDELSHYQKGSPNSVFVCSEKDATKLPSDNRVPVYILKIRPVIDEKSALVDLVLGATNGS